MDPEVLRDLVERGLRVPAPGDTNHVVTELAGVGLGHSDILSSLPIGQARSVVTYPCSSPVYLDLNAIIYFARQVSGKGAPSGYRELFEAAKRASNEGRAIFPLSESHLWAINKISDYDQRTRLTAVCEELSNFNYMLPRTSIAALEFDAGVAKINGDPPPPPTPLIRPTVLHLISNPDGSSVIDTSRIEQLHALIANTSPTPWHLLHEAREVERKILRGPSPEDVAILATDPNYQPERAVATHRSRVEFEHQTQQQLNEDSDKRWRRGRLRDYVGAREIVHEWLDLLARRQIDQANSGRPYLSDDDDQFRRFLGAMPQVQVAISLKTHLHRNPRHVWTDNDITDIDAMSVAYAYCDAAFPDKAIRQALITSKELGVFNTFVPRTPSDLTSWLNDLSS